MVLGNIVLYYCSMYSKFECLKFLFRSKFIVDIVNQVGEIVLDIVKRLKVIQCEDLFFQVKFGKFNLYVYVEYEWNF